MADEQKWLNWPQIPKPLALKIFIAVLAMLLLGAAIYKDNCISAKLPFFNIEIGPANCKK
jgi:hypothetical protein